MQPASGLLTWFPAGTPALRSEASESSVLHLNPPGLAPDSRMSLLMFGGWGVGLM